MASQTSKKCLSRDAFNRAAKLKLNLKRKEFRNLENKKMEEKLKLTEKKFIEISARKLARKVPLTTVQKIRILAEQKKEANVAKEIKSKKRGKVLKLKKIETDLRNEAKIKQYFNPLIAEFKNNSSITSENAVTSDFLYDKVSFNI
ncbi:hypothetical protein MHBO_004606 [Bonamia ostreae]|uniref:Uncharacterized protein n=1 Tax=Bonamia ostreae TaxID=126728 RepID=A0ABV2AUC9_9EUKA